MNQRVVIVGAGHAGGSAAAILRQFGWTGEIVLIGEEAIAPYQRPPLSKAFLKGEMDVESLKLRPDDFYTTNNITLRLGARAGSIDLSARRVIMEGGADEPYDILILAAGSRARKLPVPGANLAGVHELRTVADAEKLRAALRPGKRLAVVGGGYVGLEAAASARALGCEAVVIEREPRVLARVAGPELSGFFQAYHQARGVVFITSAGVDGFTDDGHGHVGGVQLGDGRVVSCDAALVGVGGSACHELAAGAGLACEGGVVVDEQARTSHPDVFAIGDMTWRPMPLYDGRMFRLESVPNALEQAKQAASAICGRPAPQPETPWFWSDQYDIKLQIAGVPFESDSTLVRGSPEAAKFALFHLKGDIIRAVEAVNAPTEFMAGRQLIGRRTPVSRAKLADPSVSMKDVAL
jgi:3-phenylpropionate/trans-cinnamate dioxygenase ferredoxin reductase subunit